MSNESNKSGGIGFVGLLQITFIVLKLTHVISWTWWWVLSPMLFGISLVALIFLVAILWAWKNA